MPTSLDSPACISIVRETGRVVAWVVGALLSVAAWALKLIEFGDPTWLGVVMLAVVVGLSSNGVYDIPTIKAFVDKWFERGALKDLRKKLE